MFPDFLTQPAELVAKRLLGCLLRRWMEDSILISRIVETEAYDQGDAAAHVSHGQSPRTRVMFGPAGYLYVYFIYGRHYGCNVVTGRAGEGSGVLIRAVEPLNHIDLIEQRRGVNGINATNGPGKVCQALGIDQNLYGHDLRKQPLTLSVAGLRPGESTIRTRRIGISKEQQRLRRFCIAGNPWVSKSPKPPI